MMLSEVLPAVKQLSALEKLRLIRILAQELDEFEAFAPFEPGKVYHLPTPYSTDGAGRILMEAMKTEHNQGE